MHGIYYLHKSHNTPVLPLKNLRRHCFRLLLKHFHVPGEIANNGYAKVLGGNRGVLWDCASGEYFKTKLNIPNSHYEEMIQFLKFQTS